MSVCSGTLRLGYDEAYDHCTYVNICYTSGIMLRHTAFKSHHYFIERNLEFISNNEILWLSVQQHCPHTLYFKKKIIFLKIHCSNNYFNSIR